MYGIEKGKIISFRGRVISSSEITILPPSILDKLIKKGTIKILQSHGKEDDKGEASNDRALPETRAVKTKRKKRTISKE